MRTTPVDSFALAGVASSWLVLPPVPGDALPPVSGDMLLPLPGVVLLPLSMG